MILVLHQGEIVERGTHQELLALKGLYHKMYLLQNGSVERVELNLFYKNTVIFVQEMVKLLTVLNRSS
ncbi:Probable multidrug resistance ABC transporter ATP-binding/permease protein YheH [Mycobacteroides abscessus subsp. abscessus]|nr:Probable multidrug resistance ABC transporter ATP-binding/permease protein YheH [Mycobacteroides abscessus subsp. abscessus]